MHFYWNPGLLQRNVVNQRVVDAVHGIIPGLHQKSASSGEFVGEGERQRAVSARNRRNFRNVESNDLCSMRRVSCPRCQTVVVEEGPWGDGKRTLTRAYVLFLARWARRLSW
jgi:hypothetical protein